jgi:hypothetical protein
MAEDKEIQKQVKAGLTDIANATKEGVTSVKQEAKKAIADIKQQSKESLTSAKEQIGKETDKAKQSVEKAADKSIKNIDKETDKAKQSVEKVADKSIKNINKETDKAKQSVEKVADKSIKNIDKETDKAKQSVEKVADESIKNVDKATANSIEQAEKSIEETSNQSIDKINDATQSSVDTVKESSDQQVDIIEKKSIDQQEEAQQKIDDQFQNAITLIKKTTENVVKDVKKRTDELKEKLDTKLTNKDQNNPSNDLTTKLLQNILSEIKILRKVTEGRVSFDPKSGRYRGAKGRYVKESDVSEQKDNKKEDSEKDKKRKGFFTSIKDRFAKPKDDSKDKLAPLKEGITNVKEGASDFFKNPLVLAGILALIAPKELFSFLKGFLGEALFGEDSNTFVQMFALFIGIWAGMKFIKPIMGLVKMVKGIIGIARFLFMNPALLLVIGLIAATAQLIGDFREKYGKRMERKTLEDELQTLEGKTYTNSPEDQAQKTKDEERKAEIKKRIEKFSEEGVFTTQGQARAWAQKGGSEKVDKTRLTRQQEDGIVEIIKYDNAVEKYNKLINSGSSPQDAEKQLANDKDFEVVKAYTAQYSPPKGSGPTDPRGRDELFKSVGFTTSTQKATAEEIVQERKTGKPTAETKPTATPAPSGSAPATAAPTATPAATPAPSGSAPTTASPTATPTATPAPSGSAPATTAPTATPAASGSAPSTAQPSLSPPSQKQEEERPKLQPITPSSGDQINNTSVAIDAHYQEPPEDTIGVLTGDTSTVPKKANVVIAMPGIFADRSAISQFEIFNNNEFTTLASAGA